MKAYSIDLREKIVAAHIQEKISIRQVGTLAAEEIGQRSGVKAALRKALGK